ncbi:small acid-soluble spore protein SspI [Bacillaceae bacterium SIJ1]|uniref:small acid-soluble spore protein SspI n=1 Tax=Litoribacterium kuwaitense TaxID=1398745 RepID=UPI0013EABE6D|nr:small acid-soluble spore protein SspI [Litoribacterium kuwaitense]NGP45002.1 small acid-soluble spore protein SspI [Litoribacterium kuwaitense]
MDLNLRKAITANVASNSKEELEGTILDAIQSGEEKMLPGLGVLFEIIWQQSDEQEQEQMLSTLYDGLR